MEAVTDAYLNPPQGTEDDTGHMQFKQLAEEFSMTPLKIRKLLITTGAYQTAISKAVNTLFREGKSVTEIQEMTNLSRASVQSNLPYSKTVYKMEERTLLAERLQKYRSRKAAADRIAEAMAAEAKEGLEELLWSTLTAFEGYPFRTAKGLRFHYSIKGNEIFFSRKEKSVTRATANITLENAVKLQKEGFVITDPKMLRCFGASYLYPVFIRIGVILNGDKRIVYMEVFMKKIMLVFGTRPEVIKMCPLVKELEQRESVKTIVCVTGPHRQMLDQVLDTFKVVPHYDLSIMKDKQTLFDITANILLKIRPVLEQERPDVVLVHGDTSTTFATALACFYLQISVGHVEAGLRTHNIYSPYPEEFNRQAVSIISKYNFAPTQLAADKLIGEGRDPKNIFVTGNTVIDAMKHTVTEDYRHPELDWVGDDKLIFITAHRRENLGQPMHNMFRTIRRVLDEHPDCKAVYPIHMNPVVRQAA